VWLCKFEISLIPQTKSTLFLTAALYTWSRIFIHTYMHICMHAYTHIQMNTHLRVYMSSFTDRHRHIHTYTHTHTYIYICIYIHTGRFIMFFVITNIYNKKIKGPTSMELFTATGTLKKGFFFFWKREMFDVCTTGDTAHIVTIFKFLPHTSQHGCVDILHCCNDPCL